MEIDGSVIKWGTDEKSLDNLREEIRQGRLDAEHLLSVIGSLNRRLLAALQRIEELEREKGGSGKVEQPFSVREEEKRQEARGRTRKRKRPGKGVRCGRLRTADKIALAQRTEQVFPDGLPSPLRGSVVRQSAPVAELLSEPETAQIAG
ncbi:hypothetical protein FJY94_08365 [Candidatus Kaiserbacteria bacterium]|nr:hypothetical protein [Candidatus Kaiserbacteria bacterium]